MSLRQPTVEQVQQAIGRMQKFRFVGLTHEWILSMGLFNFLTRGVRLIYQEQVVNNRPTNKNTKSITTYKLSEMPTDPFDGALYAAAVSRFWAFVNALNISEATCTLVEDPRTPPRRLGRFAGDAGDLVLV